MADAALDLADAVAAVAREAAQMALSRWRTDFRRSEKSDGSPVCEVDLDVDRMLRARLSALDPEAGWLSEETADNADRVACRRVWVVDPIDGTRDYIRGRTGWCVSIALVEDGAPVLAVLDAPARGEVWRAARGQGATLNDAPLRVGRRDELIGARVPADALAKADRDVFVCVEKPNSIALRIAMVAANRADLVATLRWGNEWDIAAAVLVAAEAGATATDALAQPLAFNQGDPHAFGVLVTTPGIHAAAAVQIGERARRGWGRSERLDRSDVLHAPKLPVIPDTPPHPETCPPFPKRAVIPAKAGTHSGGRSGSVPAPRTMDPRLAGMTSVGGPDQREGAGAGPGGDGEGW